MAHHRSSVKRTTVADIAATTRVPLSRVAIGGTGIGQPKLTVDKVRAMNSAKALYRAEQSMHNALTITRNPIATAGIREFDNGHDCSGYLVAKSVKDCRMSERETVDIRLSATRNRNASARPTGGEFKGPDDSSRTRIRPW